MRKESFILRRGMFLNGTKDTGLNFRKSFQQLVLLLLLATVGSLQAQELTSRPERGMSGKGTQQSSSIDSINMQNGGVSLVIPLASLPPVAGGKLSYTLSAQYNSKLFSVSRSEQEGISSPPSPCTPKYSTETVNRFNSKGGWSFGSEYDVIFRDAHSDYDYVPPVYSCDNVDYTLTQGSFFKPILVTPDGSERELRIDGYYDTYSSLGQRDHLKNYYKYTGGGDVNFSSPTRFYTVDGSFLSVVVNPTSYAVKWTIYMSDGTRVEKSADGIRTVDTNNNSILKGINFAGGYSFVRDEQTGREIRWSAGTYNNQTATKVEYQTVGGAWQTVWAVWGSTSVLGKTYTKTIWATPGAPPPDAASNTCLIDTDFQDTFDVVREIVFPATEQNAQPQKYSFVYNSDATVQTTDNAFNGYCYTPSTYTRTASIGLGEISAVTTPTGAVINYEYLYDGVHSFKDISPTSSADKMLMNVVRKKSIAHDGTTDTWTYDLDATENATGGSVNNPDGSFYAETFSAPLDPGNTGLGGLQFKAKQSGKVLTEKHWTLLGGSLTAFGSNTRKVTYNPVVDTEYTTLLAGDGTTRLKMTAKKLSYDYNGNLVQTTEYDWFDPGTVTYTNNDPIHGLPIGVPTGATVLRVINNSYYNQAADGSSTNAYHKRSLGTGTTALLGFLKDTNVGDGTTVKSKSQISYDGLSYGTAPIKGHPTQSSAWNDANGQWINSGVTYDSYGNVITTTDPKGSVTQIFYEDSTHAMPTKTITDPLNGSGQQIATTTYDFYTGAALTSTDINGNTSSVNYYNHLLGAIDPYARPGTTYSPYISIDGVNKRQTSKTYYEDAAGKTRIESDLFNEGDALIKARESRDQMGRTVLTEKNENGANTYAISSETVYKTQNRVMLQSNPHRAAASPTDGWTRATSDTLGRGIEAATFSGTSQPPLTGTNASWTGSVTSSYLTNTTTVTDQAGKKRRSVVDALGRLTRVDEPNDQNQLDVSGNPAQSTSYAYDVLGNLLTVSQGVQTRNFVYDSLSRLKQATNPESGLISYTYDNNGNLQTKRDARGIKTVYDYDALNRVLKRCYRIVGSGALGATTCTAAGSEALEPNTSDVSFIYENANVTSLKGVLTKVTNGISTTEYQTFDTLGKVLQSQQITDGAAYPAMTYTYNLSGALVEQKYPSGRVVKNVLDNDGDLSIVQSKKNQSSGYWNYADNFTYTAAGAVKSMQLGNGRWESTTFNSRLQPTQIALGTVQNGTDKLKLNFNYGTTANNGNVLSQTITVPTEVRNNTTYNGFTATQTYIYDSLNRLKSAEETIPSQTGWKQTFDYDRYGNRTFNEADTTASANFPKACGGAMCAADKRIFNPQAQTSDNKFSTANGYQYDSVGNTTRDSQSRKFTYDGENKQTKVETVDSNGNVTATLGEYFYDGDGKRIKKYVPSTGETTVFIYDASGKLVAENSTLSSLSQTVSYLTKDHLGSARITTDATGAVRARHDYQSFGEEITRASYGADINRKQFTSYERDIESTLDFAEARYYNFNHGRFTSSDPLLSSGRVEDPQTWNRYAYVLNNPLNSIDPDGLYECKGTADECKGFRNNLADAQAKLADIEKKYGKNSDEYTKAQKSLDSYGCESKGGNCIGTDGKALKDDKGNFIKDTAGNVRVSFDWTGKSPAQTSTDVTSGIVKVQFKGGNHSNFGLMANEGINSADMQSAIKTGKSVSLYQSERDGLFVQAVFGELNAIAKNSDYAYFNNSGNNINYWEKSWEAPDHAVVRANRGNAIDTVLKETYKLTPKDKKPLVIFPKGYKPKR